MANEKDKAASPDTTGFPQGDKASRSTVEKIKDPSKRPPPPRKFSKNTKVKMRRSSNELFELGMNMTVVDWEYNKDRAGWDYTLKEDPSEIPYGYPVKETNLKRR